MIPITPSREIFINNVLNDKLKLSFQMNMLLHEVNVVNILNVLSEPSSKRCFPTDSNGLFKARPKQSVPKGKQIVFCYSVWINFKKHVPSIERKSGLENYTRESRFIMTMLLCTYLSKVETRCFAIISRKLSPHPSSSLDLAPSDFFSLLNLKRVSKKISKRI